MQGPSKGLARGFEGFGHGLPKGFRKEYRKGSGTVRGGFAAGQPAQRARCGVLLALVSAQAEHNLCDGPLGSGVARVPHSIWPSVIASKGLPSCHSDWTEL